MSFISTKAFSARLHHFWTEFQCLILVTRVLYEFMLGNALVSPLPDLICALLSPGSLSIFHFSGSIRPLVDSTLVHKLFHYLEHTTVSSYLFSQVSVLMLILQGNHPEPFPTMG